MRTVYTIWTSLGLTLTSASRILFIPDLILHWHFLEKTLPRQNFSKNFVWTEQLKSDFRKNPAPLWTQERMRHQMYVVKGLHLRLSATESRFEDGQRKRRGEICLLSPLCVWPNQPTNADEGASFKVLALTKKRECDTI